MNRHSIFLFYNFPTESFSVSAGVFIAKLCRRAQDSATFEETTVEVSHVEASFSTNSTKFNGITAARNKNRR